MIGSSLDDIARRYDLRDVLQAYGVKVKGRGVVLCPLPMHIHHNNTPSLSIRFAGDRQRFTCFGNCGKNGDVIDLVGYMEVPGYDPLKLSDRIKAAELITGSKFTVPDVPPVTREEIQVIAQDAYRWFLPRAKEATEYGVKRGILPEILDEFKVGSATKIEEGTVIKNGLETLMAMPTFHSGELQGIKIRITRPSKLRFFAVKGSKCGLFNFDDVAYHNGKILIVKGEIPAMVLIPSGRERDFKVCAVSGSENVDVSTHEHIVRALTFGNKVLVGDNDRDQGVDARMKEFARKRALLLGAKLRFPPVKYKDIDEWHLNEFDAIDTILQWFEEKDDN